jgi:hypothetical protein
VLNGLICLNWKEPTKAFLWNCCNIDPQVLAVAALVAVAVAIASLGEPIIENTISAFPVQPLGTPEP